MQHSSMLKPSLSIFFLVFLLLLLPQVLQAEATAKYNGTSFPALIVMGDSIVDPGNNNNLPTLIKCNFPPYGENFTQQIPTGRFSNGRIPSDFLASSLGIKELLPAYLDPQLTPQDLLTGVSFASGGTGYDPQTSQIASALSVQDQLNLFQDYIRRLKAIAGEERAASIISDSLYVVITGTDDLANTYFTLPFRRVNYDVSSYTDLMVRSASSFYEKLYRLGARKMGIAGCPPIGCIPSQRTLGGGIRRECQPSYNQAAKEFNYKLSMKIKALSRHLPGSKLVFIDIYPILSDLVFRPSDYGFEESSKGCCGTGNLEVSVLCNRLSPTCPDVSKYVFWDSYHPTEKAYKIITDELLKNYISQIS